MSGDTPYLYSPALRLKAGELGGLKTLALDVAPYVIPRFIVPPPSERSVEQGELFVVNSQPNLSNMLAQHWRGRSAFLEVTHLIRECGDDQITTWLPKMFEQIRKGGVGAIPFVRLCSLADAEIDASRLSVANDQGLQLGLCVDGNDLVGSNLAEAISRRLERLGIAPEKSAIVADLQEADFTNPDVAAPIVRANLEKLQEIGRWQCIIFQGTHYPETNPAAHGAHELWPRNEWKIWRKAVNFNRSTPQTLVFGDYAADCAKMTFGKTSAAAIRHYRYKTGKECWLIQRAEERGSDRERMRSVCKKIVESEYFDGPEFSSADAYIYRTAKEVDGPGNATIWRQVNTNRHITRVVVDLAEVRGIRISKKRFAPIDQQRSFFEN